MRSTSTSYGWALLLCLLVDPVEAVEHMGIPKESASVLPIETKLRPTPDGVSSPQDFLGRTVSISGDLIVAGAPEPAGALLQPA